MATKMATVDKAEELLEKLRSASWNAAVQGKYPSFLKNILVIHIFFQKDLYLN